MDAQRLMRAIPIALLLFTSTSRSMQAQRRAGDARTNPADSILALDSAWARAYALHDTVLANQLMANDFFMTSSSGAVKDKQAELADVRAQPGLRMEYFRTRDARARVYGGAAVVTGEAFWQFEMNGRVVTNRRRYTAVYSRGGALGWQLVALHMGRAPEPPTGQPAGPRSSRRTPFDGPERTQLAAASVVIPLTKSGDFHYADVHLNGRAFRFALETGAGFFAVSERAATALGLTADTLEMMGGQRAPVVRVDSLTLGGATFHHLVARVSSTFTGRDFDGIISVPILKDLLATLDLAQSRLVLERGELPPPNDRDVFAVAGRDRGGRIDVVMRLGGVDVPAVIDSRSSLWLIAGDSLAATVPLVSAPRSIGSAWGPSLGTFELRGTRVSSDLRFGRYIVERPPVLFRERPGVVLGVPFLEQFLVTIDQRNQRVRLTRPQGDSVLTVSEQQWETGDRVARSTPGGQPARGLRTMGFGIGGRPDGGTLVIANVLPGSSAERLGIKAGDRLLELDGTPAASINPTVVRAAVDRGRPIKVVVLRDGRRLEFSVDPYVIP